MCLTRSCVAALIALSAAPQSFATAYQYTYTQPALGSPAADNRGGFIDTFTAKFDSSTHRLNFTVAFGPATGQTWLGTHGFWMVVTNGVQPAGMNNQFALYYFDAANINNPSLTAYAYNGSGSPNAYRYNDLLKGAFENKPLYSISCQDKSIASGYRRVMSFDLDTSSILSHIPTTAGSGPWQGTGFGSQFGLWMQPVLGYAATYGGPTGWIGNLSYTSPGWLTVTNASTGPDTPAPAAGGVLSMLTLAAARRRRRP